MVTLKWVLKPRNILRRAASHADNEIHHVAAFCGHWLDSLRTTLVTLSRLFWGTYLVFTSVYCLLAFLPYTYIALIKAPPYEWMPWFAQHQGILYLGGLVALFAADYVQQRKKPSLALYSVLAAAGLFLLWRPFLVALPNNWTAYAWSLVSLAPLVLISVNDLKTNRLTVEVPRQISQFAYSTAIIAGICTAVVYAIGSEIHTFYDRRSLTLDWGRVEVIAWSLISHVLIAVVIFSILNIIRLISARSLRPRTLSFSLTMVFVAIALGVVLAKFLDGALTFSGTAAYFYAGALATSITLFIASAVMPFVSGRGRPTHTDRDKVAVWVIAAGVTILALALPILVGGGDWNGVLEGTFAILVWIVVGACVIAIRPARASYSLVTILAVVSLCAFAYKALQETEIVWAKPLGSTDDEVSIAMETYAVQDASFQLAHHILGNARKQPCGDLCRILREYTNIRDAQAKVDVQLVDALKPSNGVRPNIFIFVIDSLRPDYLGAYNPKVDFTPNLDAFARENIALRNVYTQYAGTTLSEPAIWSGALLLHAHYLQPFSKVNSLEKLAKADAYKMVVSYDTVLSQILSPTDDMVKLDTDKPLWNRFEACSTIKQTESVLNARGHGDPPVLFYAQPMNVHQFAHNDLPMIGDDHWRMRTGFSNRIAHEVWQLDSCMGDFFHYLKVTGLYGDSIVIVTADHGDATGEFGRSSHSLSIYPEIMRVPLLIHLPPNMRREFIYDDTHLSALTDITPSLYYLLGHRPIRANALFGHPLFVESREELTKERRDELFLASDERAVYGMLTENGRFLFTTYDSPPQSFLFDLERDPNAQHNILTDMTKRGFDQQIIEHLHAVADFYGYKPGVGSLLAAAK